MTSENIEKQRSSVLSSNAPKNTEILAATLTSNVDKRLYKNAELIAKFYKYVGLLPTKKEGGEASVQKL